MTKTILTKGGIALVACVAASSVFISQGAFAQGGAGESGFSALIGRGSIRPTDPRFQPAAALVLNEASGRGKLAGAQVTVLFTRYVASEYVDRYLFILDHRGPARGNQPRELTASESLLLEEVFSQDLSKVRGTEIDRDGFSGTIKPQDLSVKKDEVIAKAKARGESKSKWYDAASKGLGPG